ncbi:PD40 domain-containing protein [Shewanella gelidii]|uniref:Hydrazine synthase alpha subunit middle domain-containing protein n=1 Tax=Shewanella gelidii TaxID=1642821 RepID=A0A917JLP9_9GAMM|nr:PD40 domain-containing protein [Shewanella gelidii]MCL1099212.1 PD40 domain-containing protein [Shewanella gelidii]GGI76511.1 hypothetical protein GCM10009332_12310 [Shewanella gelidii]
MGSTIADKALLLFIFVILTACDTDTAIKDEQPDPVLVEYPVLYIERDSVIEDGDTTEIPRFSPREPARFNPGANLFVKRNAFADSPATNITAGLFAAEQPIDIRDISVSDDGQQVLLSIRAPEIEGADDEDQPKWNIWRYDQTTQILERVIVSDTTAEQGDDLMPSFLPDGRIIFASTRQRLARAILLDEGKPQYTALDESRNTAAFNIHVMNADGTGIEQISFNLSHDLYPLVLQSGQILYSRWDAMGGNHGINLYRMNPDGTENQLMFGWHSHQLPLDEQDELVEFIKPQQTPDGKILMLLASQDDRALQKRPVIVNLTDYTDHQQPIAAATPQQAAVTDLTLNFDFDFNFSDSLSLSGRLNHLFPLPDTSERYLMSWELCRAIVEEQIRACGQLTPEQLADENLQLAPPLYELWLLNNKDSTQQLVASTLEGKVITEAVVMQPSEQPKTFIPNQIIGNELDAQLSQDLAAAIHIRSVYDFDGQDSSIQANNIGGITQLSDPTQTTAAQRPARFMRIVRGVPMPPQDVRNIPNTDFGRSTNQLMREIIGYTPIQPDGSVKVKVPANIPLAISILDDKGQRIGGRHRQWITLKAGETLECQGCHTANSTLPHGRLNAQATSINLGASGGTAYPNTNSNIIPEQGQTMAQADEMTNGLATLSADIRYQDIWTDPALSAINPALNYQYQELSTQAPNGHECFSNWTAYCRIQINYVEHIQPLWELPRIQIDEITQEVIADNTCTRCHNIVDTDSAAMVPAGQLELLGTPSGDQAAHLTSYRELFFNDVEQEEVDGILIDRLVEVLDENGNVVYQVDSNGELILDADGNPIPVLTTVGVSPIMSVNGAAASERFFDIQSNSTHDGMLTEHELKLLREWLDIGAQYYNTPFYPQD